MLYIDLYREKHEIIFLSETTRPRDLIFGIKHHLVDFYQVCLNYTPGTKNGSYPEGLIFYKGLYREQHGKIILSETTRPGALIFSI